LLALCRGLMARGHRMQVAHLKGDGTLRPELMDLGIEPRSLCLDSPFGGVRSLSKLVSCCRRFHPDVVHTHLLKANVLGAVAARFAGCRAVVASKHNDERQLRNPLIAALHAGFSRLDRRIIHASRHIERYMVEVGRVDPRRSRTIHYGLDVAAFDGLAPAGLRPQLGLADGAVVIICVARLIRRKGHLALLDAYRRVVDRTSADTALVVVGKGPMEEEVRAKAAGLGLSDRVFLTGERKDVPALLTEADLFTLASDAEGLGLVLLEAMAAAKPVVITRAGGMPELVRHGETGLVVRPGDPEALAEALTDLVEDAGRRRAMGAAGRRLAESEFSLETMVDAIEEVYRESLGFVY
jgi:glycosyltransferase involved in cell wall biosynthesis